MAGEGDTKGSEEQVGLPLIGAVSEFLQMSWEAGLECPQGS